MATHYNFARPHQSLGRNVTPAMAAGVSDHVWTCEEIAVLLDSPAILPEQLAATGTYPGRVQGTVPPRMRPPCRPVHDGLRRVRRWKGREVR
jgi:hypothetical protein